jgi:hypothetical protein
MHRRLGVTPPTAESDEPLRRSGTA